MKLAEVLEGKRAGKIQKCGIMSVIPIFYQDDDLICHGIASPRGAMRVEQNRNYGQMRFQNQDQEKVTIIPTNLGVISKQSAQDHAMSKTGLIKPRGSVHYDDAFCIEQTQGGMLSSGEYDFIVLPYALRDQALSMKGSNDYSRFWPAIKNFNAEFGISGHGHLVYFYDRFKDKLGDFIAQFEIQEGQVGAIILIDNKIVGVEVAPNPDYWKDVWKPLIRDCYGTEVIRRLVKGTAKNKPVVDSNITQANSLDELEDAVLNFEQDLKDRTSAIVAQVASQKMDTRKDDGIEFRQNRGGRISPRKYDIFDVKNTNYVGQVVKEDNFVCYASITANAGRVSAKRGFAF